MQSQLPPAPEPRPETSPLASFRRLLGTWRGKALVVVLLLVGFGYPRNNSDFEQCIKSTGTDARTKVITAVGLLVVNKGQFPGDKNTQDTIDGLITDFPKTFSDSERRGAAVCYYDDEKDEKAQDYFPGEILNSVLGELNAAVSEMDREGSISERAAFVATYNKVRKLADKYAATDLADEDEITDLPRLPKYLPNSPLSTTEPALRTNSLSPSKPA